jgi:hypothetical protein
VSIEAAFLAHLGDSFTKLSYIDPWAPRRKTAEVTTVKARLALPAPEPEPVDTQRDPYKAKDGILSLRDLSPDGKPVRLAEIAAAVVAACNIGIKEFRAERRHVELVRARHIFSYAARHLTDRSFPAIGRYLGNRDHTTILHGIKKVERQRAYFEPELSQVMTSFGCLER